MNDYRSGAPPLKKKYQKKLFSFFAPTTSAKQSCYIIYKNTISHLQVMSTVMLMPQMNMLTIFMLIESTISVKPWAAP